jgi:hypothetical protein
MFSFLFAYNRAYLAFLGGIATASGCGLVAAQSESTKSAGSARTSQSALHGELSSVAASSLTAKPDGKLYVRFERGELSSGAIADVIEAINGRIQADLKISDLRKSDDLHLATSHYIRYAQIKEGVDVDGASVRVWLDPVDERPILVEAFLADPRADVLESFEAPNKDFSDVLTLVNRDFAAEMRAGRVRSLQTSTIYKAPGGVASGFVRRVLVKANGGNITACYIVAFGHM